jgi:hypothetical protein
MAEHDGDANSAGMHRLCLPALVFLIGCADRYTADEYFHDLAVTHCQRMRECCTSDEYSDWWTGVLGVQSCEAVWQNTWPYEVHAALDAGTMTFDPVAARACLTALSAAACSAFEPAFRYRETYCESPLHGRIHDGESCVSDAECASGYCAIAAGAMPRRGSCRPTVPSGGACDSGGGCLRPEACQDDGTCGLGQAAGATCNADNDCVDHWCKMSRLASTGTCRRACDGR